MPYKINSLYFWYILTIKVWSFSIPVLRNCRHGYNRIMLYNSWIPLPSAINLQLIDIILNFSHKFPVEIIYRRFHRALKAPKRPAILFAHTAMKGWTNVQPVPNYLYTAIRRRGFSFAHSTPRQWPSEQCYYVCVPCAEQSPADRFLIDCILAAAALFDSVMLFTSCPDNTKPMRRHLDNLYHYSTSKNELQ